MTEQRHVTKYSSEFRGEVTFTVPTWSDAIIDTFLYLISYLKQW